MLKHTYVFAPRMSHSPNRNGSSTKVVASRVCKPLIHSLSMVEAVLRLMDDVLTSCDLGC